MINLGEATRMEIPMSWMGRWASGEVCLGDKEMIEMGEFGVIQNQLQSGHFTCLFLWEEKTEEHSEFIDPNDCVFCRRKTPCKT